MSTKVYSNKCKWCGVVVDSEDPVKVCECCGSSDIESTSYFIEGRLPKSHKEQMKEIAAKKRNRLIFWGAIGLGIVGLGFLVAFLASL